MSDLNQLLAELSAVERQFDTLWSKLGWEKKAETFAPKRTAEHKVLEDPETDEPRRVQSWRNEENRPKTPKERSALLPFDVKSKVWDPEQLLLEEQAVQIDEEDLQCYLIRRIWGNMEPDETLEQMLQTKQPTESAWQGETDQMGSGAMLYLALIKILSGTKQTDQLQMGLAKLSQMWKEQEPEMTQFFPLFTLLQYRPSRHRMEDILNWSASLDRSRPEGKALALMREAALECIREQDRQRAEQDRKHAQKQSAYSRQKVAVQSRHDAAVREMNRWRKPE